MKQYVKEALIDANKALTALIANDAMLEKISEAGRLIAQSQKAGGTVYSCGNGGSLCDAMHFAEELTGRYRENRPAYRAMAIADASHMACVANDFGYEAVFSRWIEGHGKPGDILLGITTSGTSKNVVAAAKAAKAVGMKVISLTGRHETPMETLSDIAIVTPAGHYADRVQELHIKVIHILIELIEREMGDAHYKD